MAGLSEDGPRSKTTSEDRSPSGATRGARGAHPAEDRGQLLLLFAFGIAVLFVVLALLLSGTIHAQNAATRSVDGDAGTDAIEYREAAERVTGRQLAAANAENDSSYRSLRAALQSGIGNWSTLTARHGVAHGRAATVTLAGTRNGTRIAGPNRTRSLTNVSGAGDWTLVDGAEATRDFRLNLSRSSLVDAASNDSNASALRNEGVFRIVVDDGETVRTVYVYQDGSSDVLLKVEAGGGLSDACRHPEGTNGHVVVHVTNASLGNESCSPLSFFDDVDGNHTVAYADGENATGTYSLVVDRHVTAVDDGDFAAAGSGDSPVATPALYGATVRVDYRTHRLHYVGTVSVVPGEGHD